VNLEDGSETLANLSIHPIGDGADPGQIDGGDLEPVLESLFTQSREFLEKMGRMAAGHAEEGDDYNLLPG